MSQQNITTNVSLRLLLYFVATLKKKNSAPYNYSLIILYFLHTHRKMDIVTLHN